MAKPLHRHSATFIHSDRLFRAENSNTTRHAAEFWMIEPEIAFSDLKDDMILCRVHAAKYVIRYVTWKMHRKKCSSSTILSIKD